MAAASKQRGRTRWKLIAVVLVLPLLAEAGLRVRYASDGSAPPHPDRSVEDEWQWAVGHLAQGRAELEGGAIYDPDLGWTTRPGLDEDGTHSTARGLRGTREVPHERTPGVPRILFVGDSYTFGFNADDEHVFSRVLERDLLPGWEAPNLGVSGHGPDQILLRYERDGVAYSPDVVVFGLYVRGYFRNSKSFRGYAKPWFELQEGELVLKGTPVVAPAELYDDYVTGRRRIGGWRYSYLLGSIGSNVAQAMERDSVDPESEDWRVMRAILARFRDRARAAGSRPILMIFPHRAEKHAGSVYEQIEQLTVATASELGLACLELSEGFEAALEREPEPPMTRPREIGGHLSDRGNRVVAEQIAAFLRERGWIDAQGHPTEQLAPVAQD